MNRNEIKNLFTNRIEPLAELVNRHMVQLAASNEDREVEDFSLPPKDITWKEFCGWEWKSYNEFALVAEGLAVLFQTDWKITYSGMYSLRDEISFCSLVPEFDWLGELGDSEDEESDEEEPGE